MPVALSPEVLAKILSGSLRASLDASETVPFSESLLRAWSYDFLQCLIEEGCLIPGGIFPTTFLSLPKDQFPGDIEEHVWEEGFLLMGGIGMRFFVPLFSQGRIGMFSPMTGSLERTFTLFPVDDWYGVRSLVSPRAVASVIVSELGG